MSLPEPNEFYNENAGRYKQYRPRYPEALFKFLASQTSRQELAWDCGTGSGGQAARGLAAHVSRVIATDPAKQAIAIADPYPGIEFLAEPAEKSTLADASVDLITVAQAIHWFDLERFYAEVQRVLAPGGIVALWCYRLPVIDQGRLDRLITDLFDAPCLTPYWPDARQLVEDGYRSLPLPSSFTELRAPGFAAEENWSLDSLIGYLNTWPAIPGSAADAEAAEFLVAHTKQIKKTWKHGRRVRRSVRWPLSLRVARKPG